MLLHYSVSYKKKSHKKPNVNMLTSGPGKFLAPTSLGAGYAVAKMLSLRAMDSELAIAQDFFYQFLAGVLLGFALRPVANLIYWKRASAVIIFSTYLIALGPLGQTFRHILWGKPFNDAFWPHIFPEVIAAIFVGIIVTFLLPSNQQVIGLGFLWRRLKQEINFPGTSKLLGCGLTYMLLFIIFQITFDESYTAPIWSDRFHEILFLPPLSPYSKILLLWGQGILNTLMLLPFFILFLREKVELIVVLGSLTFVVADFAPAFANFHRIEPLLLLDQVFIGFCLQFMFVSTAAFCFGRNQQKLQAKNFSKKPLSKQKTIK